MTNDEQRLVILDIAHQLTLLATGELNIPVPLPVTDYPRVVVVQGAQFYAKVPINPKWEPSQYGKVFGKKMILNDPSNAPDGKPLRSAAGYPLYYGPDGKARVLYGESTFSTDEQVEAYIVAVAASIAGQEKRDEENKYDFSPGPTGETEIKVEQG